MPVDQWRQYLVNDFEKSVFEKYPAIEEIKQHLYTQGAVYACMSGSGSSVFGIFKNPVDLAKQFEGMDYWSGQLH
jgi:4-diphosphocytidyl-2-C-methyl-D-erythritol kinase